MFTTCSGCQLTASLAQMRSRRRCGCPDLMETCMSLPSLLLKIKLLDIPQTDRFDNMRYFWGFVQLQDILDNAIIEMKTDTVRLGSWWVVLYTCMIVKWIIVLSKPIRERISGPNLNWLRLFKTGFFSSSSPTHASRGTTSYLVSTQFN